MRAPPPSTAYKNLLFLYFMFLISQEYKLDLDYREFLNVILTMFKSDKDIHEKALIIKIIITFRLLTFYLVFDVTAEQSLLSTR